MRPRLKELVLPSTHQSPRTVRCVWCVWGQGCGERWWKEGGAEGVRREEAELWVVVVVVWETLEHARVCLGLCKVRERFPSIACLCVRVCGRG